METCPLFEKHKSVFIDLMNTNSANLIDIMLRVGAYLADHCVKQNLSVLLNRIELALNQTISIQTIGTEIAVTIENIITSFFREK